MGCLGGLFPRAMSQISVRARLLGSLLVGIKMKKIIFGLDFFKKCVTIIMLLVSGYSSLVERQLPKLERRVRFPLSALLVSSRKLNSTQVGL